MTSSPTRLGVIPRAKRLRFALTLVVLVAAATELLAILLTPVLDDRLFEPVITRQVLLEHHAERLQALLDTQGGLRIHEDLGWHYRRGFAFGPDTINRSGLRAAREYSSAPTLGIPRIAAFGDSFVYCQEVSIQECWTTLVESSWRAEVLNYGVGGYGTDQAFLRYLEEGHELGPSTVLIGFAPVDLRRVVNRYRGFISLAEGAFFKPRFVLEGDSLALLPPPVASRAEAEQLIQQPDRLVEIGEFDTWYEPALYEHRLYRWSALYRLFSAVWRPTKRRFDGHHGLFKDDLFDTGSEAFALQVRIIEAFADSVRAVGARPAVVMLPDVTAVTRDRNSELPQYAPLTERLLRMGIDVLDPLPMFSTRAERPEAFFAPGGHYSAAGNRVIAMAVAAFLGLAIR